MSPKTGKRWADATRPADDSEAATRAVAVHLARVKRLTWFSGFCVVGLFGLVAVTLPATLQHNHALNDNLALKNRMQSVEAQIGDVNRVLIRLRLYDARLRQLSGDEVNGPKSGE